ncbi:MAG: IS3 family transposase [Ilumatobacteraceae bacterium]
MIDALFVDLQHVVGTDRACRLTGRAKATHYRRRAGPRHGPRKPLPSPSNALTVTEREHVLGLLRGPRFRDLAVAQVWAMMLDEGVYLCSQATMHRLLREAGENRDRRRQRTHPAKVKPHLVANATCEVWSWDITKLPGPARGVYFDAYVIIDIFSRYIVGWRVEDCEDSTLAAEMIETAITTNDVPAGRLTIHADRGAAMTSKTVAQLLEDLGVTRTHSRPHVSDDNPYIEAHFKTLKYCPAWPGHFDTLADARVWCEQFFDYYNHHHRHRNLGLHTPASVHHDTATGIRAQRTITLTAAFQANPSRFARRPRPPQIPTTAWINNPDQPLIQNK